MHKGAQYVSRSLKLVLWNRGWKKPSFCLERWAAQQEKKECCWHLFSSPLRVTASHRSLLLLGVQPAGHIMPLHAAQRRTEASMLPRKCTKINVPHSSNHETRQSEPEQFSMSHKAQITIFCSCRWTLCPALSSLGRTQNAKASQRTGRIPPGSQLWSHQSPAWESEKTHKYTPKNNNSRKVNSRHIARRRSGTWQHNKSDSRSRDKSETSSHLTAVHAVYELTYDFTWYTHSIPDEHRANKPLKDSCELYKYCTKSDMSNVPTFRNADWESHTSTWTKTHSI